jgi:micrococcal nuclease
MLDLRRRSRRLGAIACFVVIVAPVSPSAAKSPVSSWKGKVVSVADGDTITVLHDKRPVRIRLHGVDAPEKKQAFGRRAKQFTSKFAFGKLVTVKVVAKSGKYGRTIGEVFVGGHSLNEAIVRAGLAWWYRKYARRAKVLALLEAEARKAKRGLWSDPHPIAPWEFRHRRQGLRCNVTSRVCHRAGCRHYRCRNCTRRVRSTTVAKKAGFRLYRACK